MGVIRDSFIIFSDWDRAIRKAPENVQLELYHALMDFAQTGEKPTGLSWEADMFFSAIETKMKNTISRYTASVENGKLGGRPRKCDNLEQPSETQQNLDKPKKTQQNLDEPTRNLIDNDIVIDIDNKKEKINKKEKSFDDVLSAISDADLKTNLIEFIKSRKALKKPLTSYALELAIKRLFKISDNPTEQIEIVKRTITNGWLDFYPLKIEKEKVENFLHNNYSKDQIDELITNLDDVEL